MWSYTCSKFWELYTPPPSQPSGLALAEELLMSQEQFCVLWSAVCHWCN
jgi:hypothetical protein